MKEMPSLTIGELTGEIFRLGRRYATRHETREALRQRKPYALRLLLEELRGMRPEEVPRKLRETILSYLLAWSEYGDAYRARFVPLVNEALKAKPARPDDGHGLAEELAVLELQLTRELPADDPLKAKHLELLRLYEAQPAPAPHSFEDHRFALPGAELANTTIKPAEHYVPVQRFMQHGGPETPVGVGWYGCEECLRLPAGSPCVKSCPAPGICGSPQFVGELVADRRRRAEALWAEITRVEREALEFGKKMHLERSEGTPLSAERKRAEKAAEWIGQRLPTALRLVAQEATKRSRGFHRETRFPTPSQLLAVMSGPESRVPEFVSATAVEGFVDDLLDLYNAWVVFDTAHKARRPTKMAAAAQVYEEQLRYRQEVDGPIDMLIVLHSIPLPAGKTARERFEACLNTLAGTDPLRLQAGFRRAATCALELWAEPELWTLLGERYQRRYLASIAQ